MNLIKMLVGGAAIAAVVSAFRDFENRGWLEPALPRYAGEDEEFETEPVLGYDGMDEETLIGWLGNANLDRQSLLRIRSYERSHDDRETVLAAIDDLL